MSRRFASRSGRSAGLTLVEAMISTSVVAISLLATLGSIGTSMRVTRTVNEREVAQRAATAALQEMAATDFALLLATYDGNAANDPDGAGTAPGDSFAVADLSPPDGVLASAMGRVTLPLVGGQVREDVVIAALGMPRDLNGDGAVDALDHSADYKVLPVLVEVSWKGVDGDASIAMPRVFAAR